MSEKPPEWLQKALENIRNSDEKPIFSHEIIVSSMVKAVKTKNGIEKEAQLVLVFVDMTNLKPVGKYVITLSTANGLIGAVKNQLDNIEKELKSKDMKEIKNVAPTASSEKDLSYIG
jgi:hypothetical protein